MIGSAALDDAAQAGQLLSDATPSQASPALEPRRLDDRLELSPGRPFFWASTGHVGRKKVLALSAETISPVSLG